MSRAFVKESDEELAANDLPERPLSADPNYVTAHGKQHIFHIVGDDEADVAAGSISWASPLAKAMIGAKVGDTVKWRRPAGASETEIVAIRYDALPAAGRK